MMEFYQQCVKNINDISGDFMGESVPAYNRFCRDPVTSAFKHREAGSVIF